MFATHGKKYKWHSYGKNVYPVSRLRAEKPLDFKPENYFKYAIGITSGNEDPTIVQFTALSVAAKYIASQPFHASQTVLDESTEKTLFSLHVTISEELIRALLSYGGEVTILEPASLKEEIHRRALAILSKN